LTTTTTVTVTVTAVRKLILCKIAQSQHLR
jgi:hypothetical protein